MSVAAFGYRHQPAHGDFSSHHSDFDIHQPDTRQQQKNAAIPPSLLKSLFSGRVSDTTSQQSQGQLVQDADLASMGVSQRVGSRFDKVFGNAAFEDDDAASTAPTEPGNVRHNNLFETSSSRSRQQQPDQRAVHAQQQEERSEQQPPADVSSRGPSIIAGFFGRKTISPNSTLRADEPLGTLVQAFRGSERDEEEHPEPSELPSAPLERVLISWEVEIKQMMASGMRDEAIHRAAPSHGLIRCYVKRNKHVLGASTYEMFLECGDVFLLAARKRKKTKMSTYVISQDVEDLKRDTDNCIAKLKANFVGTEYMLWGKGGEKDVRKGYASEDVCLSFQNTVGKKGGPRIMHVIMPLPDSGWQPSAVDGADCLSNALGMAKSKTLPPYLERKMMSLCTKPAEYSEVSKGYTLDFQGRVKEASVKNFQLVAWDHNLDRAGSDVLLQFGKVDNNTYALDFAYPMSIESAFAVALASIDTKLCCTI